MIRTQLQKDLRAALKPLPAQQRSASIQMIREGHDLFTALLVPDMVNTALQNLQSRRPAA